MSFIMVIGVILVVGFIYWQWKMLKKYALTYDKFKLNLQEKYVSVNGREIRFEQIDCVTVRELPQPALYEKALSKSACYTYMAQLELHLKQGEMVPATFNTKGALYHVLKQLTPFIPVRANIDAYKPKIGWGFLLWVILVILLVFIFKVG